MRRSQVYDERQILERGKAYRYGFFAALLIFVLNYLLQECAWVKIDGYTVMISGIWMPLAVCLITLIVKDAYDYVDSTAGRSATAVFGMVGLGVLVYTILEVCLWGEGFYQDGVVTNQVGFLVMGFCMVLVCIVYWVKRYVSRNIEIEE